MVYRAIPAAIGEQVRLFFNTSVSDMVNRVASLATVVGLTTVKVVGDVNLPRCSADVFKAALPEGARLEAISAIASGGTFGEGPSNIPYPINPTNLPELCAIIVNVTSSPRSYYRFGLFLPSNWSGRFLAVGNGGFAGGINWLDMGPGPHYGMATMSTDTGHNSSVIDMSWALNNLDRKIDFGYRAMQGSVALAKILTQVYYNKTISRSYYNGCSSGGRQGLKQIQIAPESFDGILVGAPAWYSARLNTWAAQVSSYNLPPSDPKRLNWTQYGILADEVLRQCDHLDGVRDNILGEPDTCNLDFGRLTCGRVGVDPSRCLTPPQVQTAKNIYSDWVAKNGSWLYYGFSIGSEWNWLGLQALEEGPFGLSFLRYYIYDDPNYSSANFSEKAVDDAIRLDPGKMTADNYDLSAFKAHGGKIIMYHGMADGVVPTKGTDLYYQRVMSKMGSLEKTQDFFRYFKLPGVQHCLGTPETERAPWMIAGAAQAGAIGTDTWSVPGFKDAKHDALLALVDWVEKGRSVDTIIATTWVAQLNPSSGVLRQRPICPYPKKQVWDRRGSLDLPSSWSCR